MPLIKESAYKPGLLFRNGHISTIYASAFRKSEPPVYKREKLTLPDGDFLLIDYQISSHEKAVILCHGLEGESTSKYNNSAARYFLQHRFSVFSWNNRSCGGEMNLLPQLYHHASIEDLGAVVNFVLDKGFKEIFLLGFSLGGAQILSYFGRKEIDQRVKAGVAVSTPINLKNSAHKIENGFSKIYMKRLIKNLRNKLFLKAQKFPDILDARSVENIRNFEDLAREFIVPVHRFASLDDYYLKASPAEALAHITTPALIINSLDDPFLGATGYPKEQAKANPFLYLETPAHGGHCAFPISGSPFCYPEIRALQFFNTSE